MLLPYFGSLCPVAMLSIQLVYQFSVSKRLTTYSRVLMQESFNMKALWGLRCRSLYLLALTLLCVVYQSLAFQFFLLQLLIGGATDIMHGKESSARVS